jgi:hypothetical protein
MILMYFWMKLFLYAFVFDLLVLNVGSFLVFTLGILRVSGWFISARILLKSLTPTFSVFVYGADVVFAPGRFWGDANDLEGPPLKA